MKQKSITLKLNNKKALQNTDLVFKSLDHVQIAQLGELISLTMFQTDYQEFVQVLNSSDDTQNEVEAYVIGKYSMQKEKFPILVMELLRLAVRLGLDIKKMLENIEKTPSSGTPPQDPPIHH